MGEQELEWLSAWSALPPGSEVVPGATSADLHAFHRRPPDPPGAVFERDVDYGGCVPLLLYRRADPSERRPVVLLVHGGGWTSFDAWMHIRYAHALAQRGFVAASVGFRQLPEGAWPRCLEDVKRAVRWVRAHAERIGADAEAIGIVGNSAGGHLAALVALTPGRHEGDGWLQERSDVRAAFLLYPVTDVRPEAAPELAEVDRALLRGNLTAERLAEASPVDRVHGLAPPILTVTGSADTTTPLSMVQRFHEALEAVGADHRLEVLTGRGHAFDWAPDGWQAVADRMLPFFEEHLCRP